MGLIILRPSRALCARRPISRLIGRTGVLFWAPQEEPSPSIGFGKRGRHGSPLRARDRRNPSLTPRRRRRLRTRRCLGSQWKRPRLLAGPPAGCHRHARRGDNGSDACRGVERSRTFRRDRGDARALHHQGGARRLSDADAFRGHRRRRTGADDQFLDAGRHADRPGRRDRRGAAHRADADADRHEHVADRHREPADAGTRTVRADAARAGADARPCSRDRSKGRPTTRTGARAAATCTWWTASTTRTTGRGRSRSRA